ncbi:Protease HtpX [Capillimicrobium parvum]|uniref:Protease HtpX n=2 Tax=Capillimicrobium parvum TaxID=2884022 RepID=A0A9E7C0M9_9ACTN|nr:Protease HtpX [Capillimicrobium parvum]
MVVAAVLTPLVVLAAVAAVVLLLPLKFAIAVGIAAVIGIARAVRARNEMDRGRSLARESAPELHDAVERLCALADLPKPDLVLDEERQPNSWIIAPIGKRPQLHVTRGLLAALTPEELEAVVAHELAHLLNRDAMVMTVVGTPGAVLLEGGRQFWGAWWMWFGNGLALAIGWVAQFGTSALSRYRELAADAGAVALTGRPATLASALVKVSGGIDRVPISDLRAVAGRDSFHLLPTDESDFAPLRTHPALKRRLERLERMERDLHAGGLAYRPADEPPA